jgi:hypothetical protein
MLRMFLLSTCALAALAGCGAGPEVARPGRGELTLEQAEAFDDFPLYFAGDRLNGLPLTAILRRNDTANYVSFVYGECEPAALDQGCAPPAEIQVWPRERRPPERYDAVSPMSPVAERATIRGTAANFFDEGTRLELYAGPSTVVIFAGSRQGVLAIADALHCVGDRGRSPPGGPLDC